MIQIESITLIELNEGFYSIFSEVKDIYQYDRHTHNYNLLIRDAKYCLNTASQNELEEIYGEIREDVVFFFVGEENLKLPFCSDNTYLNFSIHQEKVEGLSLEDHILRFAEYNEYPFKRSKYILAGFKKYENTENKEMKTLQDNTIEYQQKSKVLVLAKLYKVAYIF